MSIEDADERLKRVSNKFYKFLYPEIELKGEKDSKDTLDEI